MNGIGLGVVELADAIAKGEVSSEAAMAARLELAERSAELNAIVALEADEALTLARARDAELKAGHRRGPLHGVPMAHKDMFYRAGKPSDCGSLIMKGFVPSETSPLITRLESAGAITFGRLNMAEFALSPTGQNAHTGRACNPWRLEAITGGSSSGSAAAIAAGITPASMGSDTGGSVRLPAGFCGIVGLKPTNGLLPLDGMMPLSFTMDTAGPMARSSRDLARMMTVLTGGAEDYESGLAARLPGVRIGVPDRYFTHSLDTEVAGAFEQAQDAFRILGATVVTVAVPDIEPYGEMSARISFPEAASKHKAWLEERPQDYGEQVRNRLLQGLTVLGADYILALEDRRRAQADMLAGPLSDCDLLMSPVCRRVTPDFEQVDANGGPEMNAMIADLSALTRVISMLGFPALCTPMGADDRGLPIGMQLIGRPGTEALLLRAGSAFEGVTEWSDRRPPDAP